MYELTSAFFLTVRFYESTYYGTCTRTLLFLPGVSPIDPTVFNGFLYWLSAIQSQNNTEVRKTNLTDMTSTVLIPLSAFTSLGIFSNKTKGRIFFS